MGSAITTEERDNIRRIANEITSSYNTKYNPYIVDVEKERIDITYDYIKQYILDNQETQKTFITEVYSEKKEILIIFLTGGFNKLIVNCKQ